MPKSPGPVELLRTHRQMFEAQASIMRDKAKAEPHPGVKRAYGAEAYAWENAVKQIDNTLRDWA